MAFNDAHTDEELQYFGQEIMTQAAKKLLDAFDALPDQERAEVLAELLRRTALAPHDLPTDEDLIATADHLFRELDQAALVRNRKECPADLDVPHRGRGLPVIPASASS